MENTMASTMELVELCRERGINMAGFVTFLQLLTGISSEEADRVLYQASVTAAAEQLVKMMPASLSG